MPRSERGTAAVEMVMAIPVLVMVLALVVSAGRLVGTKTALATVAREAARAAAAAPDASAARSRGAERARQVAGGLGLSPTRLRITQRPGAFARGGIYEVRVSYRVGLLRTPFLAAIPSSAVLASTHAEPIEAYKSR